MSEPIVFISHFRVREGKRDELRVTFPEAARRLELEKPCTRVFLGYLDEDGAEVKIVHVFADAEAMDLHLEGSQDRARAAYELIEPMGWEIYGQPSSAALVAMRAAAATAGVRLTMLPERVAGFLRSDGAPAGT